MRLMAAALAALACLIVPASQSRADDGPTYDSKDYEAEVSPRNAEGRWEIGVGVLKFKGTFTTWTLLGEPVSNCTATWRNEDDARSVKVAAGPDRIETAENVRPGEMEIYNLVVVGQQPDPRDEMFGKGSAKYVAVICDAGVVGQNGQKAFNVAGSPSWDQFLCALPAMDRGSFSPNRRQKADDDCARLGGEWVDAAAAKAMVKKGLDLGDFQILRLEINDSGVRRRVEKRTWREISARFKRERASALAAALEDGSIEGDITSAEFTAHLPNLPEHDPSQAQLDAYEAAYQKALKASGEDDSGFNETWKRKERPLVKAELDHMRHAAASVKARELAMASYRADLEERAKSAPKYEPPREKPAAPSYDFSGFALKSYTPH